jgi:peptide/nickel transport system substrate-binding protein
MIGAALKYATNPEPIHIRSGQGEVVAQEGGMENLKVDISAPPRASRSHRRGPAHAKSCQAAGIDINVVREPDDGYWSNVWLKSLGQCAIGAHARQPT